MATKVVGLAEYLETEYRPDREWVDGELRERNVGKFEHARLQGLIMAWFREHEREWRVVAAPEQRVQVSATRVRIPDVVVLERKRHPETIVDAPILAVEILSPDDSYVDTQQRSQDYLEMGVRAVWVVDPKTWTARVGNDNSHLVGAVWAIETILQVPGTPIVMDLGWLFGELDETQNPHY